MCSDPANRSCSQSASSLGCLAALGGAVVGQVPRSSRRKAIGRLGKCLGAASPSMDFVFLLGAVDLCFLPCGFSKRRVLP